MTSYLLRQAMKAFPDDPEFAAKLNARAFTLELGENAERKRRQALETCNLEVRVTVGDLARLVHIAERRSGIDDNISEAVQRIRSKIDAAQLELLGWEGEPLEPPQP